MVAEADDVDVGRRDQLQQGLGLDQRRRDNWPCAMFWSIRRPNFSMPCSLSAIQILSARKPRVVCSP